MKELKMMSRVFFTICLLLFWYSIGKKMWKPYVVFQVYGTERDKRAYFTPWMERLLPLSFPIAIIRVGYHLGLVAGTMVTAEELDADPSRAMDVVQSATKQYRTRAIALAGRLPSLIRKAGGAVTTPAVEGGFGTRYAMVRCALELTEKFLPTDVNNVTFGIIGAGFIGKQVATDLSGKFKEIIAFDTRFSSFPDRTGNVISTSNTWTLRRVNAVIVFTPKGDDVVSYVRYFDGGVVVADDTHPCMKQPTRQAFVARGVVLRKAVTTAKTQVQIFPRLPNFRADSVPGCLLEALVVAKYGRKVLRSEQEFFRAAKKYGFRPVLMEHPADS